MNEVENYSKKIFEEIKHVDEYGNEYWLARELQKVLEYSQWRRFHELIKRAQASCKLSKINVSDHFAVDSKMIDLAKGAKRKVIDYKLSRYACYLIVQNGNPSKKVIALGQTYFAIQTRKQEITEKEYQSLTEDEKRLYVRMNVNNKNKSLFYQAKKSGVKNFGKFNNYGYRGLYNETAEQIHKRKQLKENEEILDYMGSEELGANLFRITQTEAKLKKDRVNNESVACNTHYVVGKTVRKAISELGGTMPEELPTPEKSVHEIEQEELQKLLNHL